MTEYHHRTPGDDTIIQLRIRTANLPALESPDGVTLGLDALTQSSIVLRLVPRADGIHDLQVITNAVAKAATPEPVDAQIVYGTPSRSEGPSEPNRRIESETTP